MKRLTPETEAKEPDERDGIEVMRQWSRDDDAELKALLLSEPEENAPGAGSVSGTPAASSIPAGSKDFEFISADDVDTWQDPEWWLYQMFPKYGVGQLYGDSGAGKSFLVLDLAHALVTGSNWFGWQFIADEGRHPHVFYLALEGSHGVKLRIKALQKREAERLGRKSYPLPDLHLSKISLDITNHHDIDALAKQIIALSGGVPPVVIIDTLQQSMPALDFSSSKDMSLVMAKAQELQAATKGFVLLVAHLAKGGDPRKGAFGSVVQKGVMDWQVYVEKVDGTNIRKFTIAKLKDGIDGDMRGFSLCERMLGQDRYGKPQKSATVERETVPDELHVTKTQLEMLKSLESVYLAEGKKVGELVAFDAWKDALAVEYDLEGDALRTKANNWKRTLCQIGVIDTPGKDVKLLKTTGSVPCV